MKTSKYFKPEEFERCNPSCSIEDMDQDFLDLLDDLREKAGTPLVLNCAYRSKEHDKAKGRSGNSAHTEGLAVDIRPQSDEDPPGSHCIADPEDRHRREFYPRRCF